MAIERNQLWTPQDVADYCKVSLQTVYKWNAMGTGPEFRKLGKHCRYKKSDVLQWVDRKPSNLV